VTLTLSKAISNKKLARLELKVSGDENSTLTDSSPRMNRFDGDANAATPGGDYVRDLSQATLRSVAILSAIDELLDSGEFSQLVQSCNRRCRAVIGGPDSI
jgi:hypothetical protein